MIVTDFGDDVHTYLDQSAHLDFPRPAACLVCQVVGRMIGHGFYRRKALVAAGQAYRVPIKRWICDACHHTVALLPSFLLPYRHYLLAVIQAVVITRFEDSATWAQGAQRCSVNEAPSPRTIGRWCDTFAEHAATWWAAVQQTLAEHDAGSPMLDPLGEAAGPRDTPRALLHAALHLLAWAKTRWTELAHYGLKDRFRFLWHWGASHGLGRLI
jgi:hypothetical protein